MFQILFTFRESVVKNNTRVLLTKTRFKDLRVGRLGNIRNWLEIG